MVESFVVKYGDDGLYCKSIFMDGSIFLTVLAGNRGYRGQLTEDTLAEIQVKVTGLSTEVLQMARQTFLTQSDHYRLSLEDDQLIWRKLGGKIKLRLAAIQLTPLNPIDAQTEVLDHLMDWGAQSCRDLQQCQAQLEEKSKSLVRSVQLNNSLADRQREGVDLLVQEFIPLLNAKKRRILELESLLRNGGSLDPQGEESAGDNSAYEGSAGDNSAYEGSTDEEEPGEPARGEKRKSALEQTDDGPNKSSKIDDSFEESLFEVI